jgi:hypothetical protein
VIERIFSPDSDGELPHAIPLPQLIDLMTDLWEGKRGAKARLLLALGLLFLSFICWPTNMAHDQKFTSAFFHLYAPSTYHTSQRTAFSIEASPLRNECCVSISHTK